jgi:hypothetical protein
MLPDRARNTLNQARRLSLNSTSQTFRDAIAATDKDDLYRFTAGNRSRLDLTLKGVRRGANVNVELYALQGDRPISSQRIGKLDFSTLKRVDIRRNLDRLARATRPGSANETLNLTLEAGSYYIRVYRRAGNTNYRLALATTPEGEPNQIDPDMGGTSGMGGTDGMGGSNPNLPIEIDLSTWLATGDVLYDFALTSQVTLTNAFPGGDPGDVDDPNVSGMAPLTVFGTGSQNFAGAIGLTSAQLNQLLGIGPNATPSSLGYREGSAIYNPDFAAIAGDVLSLDWSFLQKDAPDLGFVKIGTSLFKLESASPFSYAFPASGSYDIAIGVIDVNDFSRSSVLQISGANLFQ